LYEIEGAILNVCVDLNYSHVGAVIPSNQEGFCGRSATSPHLKLPKHHLNQQAGNFEQEAQSSGSDQKAFQHHTG
jgi:hypothetical protein